MALAMLVPFKQYTALSTSAIYHPGPTNRKFIGCRTESVCAKGLGRPSSTYLI